jgi:glycosyltransferase involved in cell wall biosynthesis
MKVAYVLPYLSKPCGWRTFSTGAIQALHKFIDPVLFVAVQDISAARSLFPNLPVYVLPTTQQASLSSVRGWKPLAETFWKLKRGSYPVADLVHSFEAFPTGLVGGWLARRLGCPHVITAHGTYAIIWHDHPWDRRVYQKVLSQVQMVFPVSHGTASLLLEYFGSFISPNRLRPILNGNDFYRHIPQPEALGRTVPAIPTLLTVGDVKHRKGQLISLIAFTRVKEKFPSARYWIVGNFSENDYYHQLQKVISDNRVEGVTFLGRVSDEILRECYRQATVFVLTPQPGEGADRLHFEGFGLVYLEAGAYGLPVVGTRLGGVPDAVREGETGLLVEPDDVEGLAGVLIHLLSDPHMATEMGRANRRWAETLTWERFAEEQYQAYQGVIASK